MAVPIEARGQFQEFLDVLRRRAWQISVPAVFVITIGSCLAVIIPRKFLAKTQLELRQVGLSPISKEGQNAKFQVKAPARIKKVVEELRNPVYQALLETDRREFLKTIDKNLDVQWTAPGQQSSIFITLTYTDLNRGWAGTFLKALREDWTDDVLELDRKKLEEGVRRLGEERDKLLRNYEKEEDALADLKKRNGLSAMQSVPGTGILGGGDPEYDRLQAHKSLMSQIVTDLAERRGQIAYKSKLLEKLPERITSEKIVPGSTHASEIRETELRILALEDKLREYKPQHPNFQKLQIEIRDLERRREDLEGLVTASQLTTVMEENPQRAALRRQIEDAEAEVAALEAKRKSLAENILEETKVVQDRHQAFRDVSLAMERINRMKDALIETEGRYQLRVQDAELSKGPRSNPFVILEEINVPNKATEPNPWIVVAFSVVAGLGLGIGLAVLLEFSKSCFRSVYDISRVMATPVLGNINTIVTHRETRQRLTRRLAVGAASFLLLGSLCFVTWAWAQEQDSRFLSPPLRRAIEGLRSVLK